MIFSKALEEVSRKGSYIKRTGWNGPDQNVFLIDDAVFNEEDIELEPFLAIKNQQGKYVPWSASQGDLLADDWILCDN
jgi:hypothetical protein